MVFVINLDDRVGSAHLEPYLAKAGVPCTVCRLPFGDAAFTGLGPPDRKPVQIGVEIKSLSDLLDSITSHRFTGRQLPGMLKSYDYPFLLVEVDGLRRGAGDRIETRGYGKWIAARSQFRWSALFGYCVMLQVQARMPILWSIGYQDTANQLARLYAIFQKPWSQHRSMMVLPPSPAEERLSVVEPSLIRLFANHLPGVGYEWSDAVDAVFECDPAEFFTAPASVWAAITRTNSSGKHVRFGAKRAARVWATLHTKGVRISDSSFARRANSLKG